MIEVIRAAAEVQRVCERNRWRFCIIGGLALLRWGEPRETVDVALTLLTGLGNETAFIEELTECFEPRLADARDFALRNRVLLLRAASGVGIDVALAWIPFEERVVNRSTLYEFQQGVSLRTCSADDLIVMKAFAGRGKDWVDVENVIVRQSGKLDWDTIFQEIDVLAEAKGEPEIVTELGKRREDFENI